MKDNLDALLTHKVWIWGTSKRCLFVAKLLISNGVNIVGFTDNDVDMHGKQVLGKTVWDPNEIYGRIKEDIIVICCVAAKNNASIIKQLNENGIYRNIVEWNTVKYEDLKVPLADFLEVGYENRIVSKCCCQVDFEQEYFKRIVSEIGMDYCCKFHRKVWEFVYIIHVLEENGMLTEGKKGLGFAVGEEPLPSYFASKGVEVLATDLSMESETASTWIESGQNAAGDVSRLFRSNIVTKSKFDENVTYMDLDMNHIPDDIGKFDFCWSSCAIEHVGGLELSKQFLKNMIKILKPGGIAVHTTEFNLWSNDETIENGFNVIYRRKDFEEIQKWMNDNKCEMVLSFKRTQKEADTYLPLPPYVALPLYPGLDHDRRNHLNLILDNFVSTSYGLIIKKQQD